MTRLASFAYVLLVCSTGVGAPPTQKPIAPQAAEFFETKVRPILANHCVSCHGPKKQQAELRLDSKMGLLKGSDSGPVIIPGDPDKSPLIRAIRHTGDPKMPPREKLPDNVIAALTAWVKMGAPWPETPTTSGTLTVAEVRPRHWSFQPVREPLLPANATPKVAYANPVDDFITAKLEKQNLTLSPEADRRTLLRRLSFDLIGLPPTPEEFAAFEEDSAPDAYEKVVERLLASPHYGERWARHWLDVARYADNKGYVFEEERRYPFAYTYRDYVIRSLNEDLPYDQFIVHQLAADRLDLKHDPRPLAAMGFLTLGRRFLNNTPDIIDDRIDVTMRGLQGLTVACARCHDHKFDPIPSRDYYSLYGVFASSVEPKELPSIALPTPTPTRLDYQQKLTRLQQDVEDFKKKHAAELKANNRKFADQLRGLQKKVDQLKAVHPGAPASAMVLNDAPNLFQPYVFLRGNPGNRGESVPRRYLEVVAGEQRKPFTEGSGRLELARAIASKDNPLTARVLVNRVWMHHFGQGLVRTPSDFGLRGEPPTHPELLDYLAARFMENGWSIKKLHRLIVLSRTYRQRSDERQDARLIDPENRLLSRMNRRRLDFEAMRDGLLAVSGQLDRTMAGAPVDIVKVPSVPRRTLYGFIDRQNLPGMFRTFDLASPDAHVAQRHSTTVPQQALFLMNNPLVVEQARQLIARPEIASLTTPEQRIDRLHRVLYGRAPDAEETTLGVRFIEQASKQEEAKPGSGAVPLNAWQQYAQVLLLANEFVFVD
jgi:mono/diheme cytochrome c family protein